MHSVLSYTKAASSEGYGACKYTRLLSCISYCRAKLWNSLK